MDVTRSRSWTFTENNPTPQMLTAYETLSADFIIYAPEVGESGTPHLQGYFEMPLQTTMSALKKKLSKTAHFEAAKGTAQQNINYIQGPYDNGDKHKPYNPNTVIRGTPKKQGARNDLETIRTVIKDGGNFRQVLETATSYQSVQMAQVYLKYFEPTRKWTTKVRWFFGDTGCGKTSAAEEWLGPDHYPVMSNAKWWEGYDAHPHVLIDDFRKTRIPFDDLIRLLEKGEYRVECKQGSRQMLAKRIAVTSQDSPEEMFAGGKENISQLLDRLEAITEFRGESWRTKSHPEITTIIHKHPPRETLGNSETEN